MRHLAPLLILALAACGGGNASDKPTWQLTCGDPVCGGGHRPSGLPACGSAMQEGSACTTGDPTCDPQDSCNAELECTVADPAVNCPISRRIAKKDIHYLTADELAAVDSRARHVRLATWHYNAEPETSRTHLGFIIDDDETSPSVARDGGHVDLYGYDSMTLAAVQVQAEHVAALEAEVRELKAEIAAIKAAR